MVEGRLRLEKERTITFMKQLSLKSYSFQKGEKKNPTKINLRKCKIGSNARIKTVTDRSPGRKDDLKTRCLNQ